MTRSMVPNRYHLIHSAGGAVFFALALFFAQAAHAQSGPNGTAAKVRVADAQSVAMSPRIEVPGTVISRNDARVAAEIAGRMTFVAEVGTVLAEGDVLARLDDRMWRIELANSEAEIKRLDASLRFNRKEVGRLRELAKTNNVPARRLDEAVAQMEVLEQQVEQAKIARERTLYTLDRTEIKAPFPGHVVERLLEPGEYSNAGAVVARLVDTDHIELRAQVPVRAAGHLRDGMTVGLVSEEERHESPIRTIIPVGDEVTRTVEVRIEMPDASWLIGHAVRVSVPSAAPREVLAVPRDALVIRSDSIYVFKIEEGNKARRLAVRTGSGNGTLVEITGALSAGDKVVVRGAESLRDGQDVEILATS